MDKSSFGERLKEEIEKSGLLQKEVAFKADVKKRALDMYLGSQKSIPPADVATRLATVLGTTVEYLVNGVRTSVSHNSKNIDEYIELYLSLNDDSKKAILTLMHQMRKS